MPDAVAERVRLAAPDGDDWPECVLAAEREGLGPLLHAHARAGLLSPPEAQRRQLLATYVRHRRENEVRLRALAEVLDALDRAAVPVVVLKGPALIHFVYGDAGLRPLSDVDLLVPTDAVPSAQRTLGELGFLAPMPPSEYREQRKHHLTPATRVVDGVAVVFEVHRDAFGSDRGVSLPWTARGDRPLTFPVNGRQADSLGLEEMLWHLCRHMTGLWHPLRLIWIADVIGFCDRFAGEIDWRRIERDRPFVLSALALIDALTPLPETVRTSAPLRSVGRPVGTGCDYAGWPRTAESAGRGGPGRRAYVRATLQPPEWWLRLNYGAAGRSLAGARWRHGRALVRMAVRRVRDELSLRAASRRTRGRP